ncbi:MAG: MFS transporter [Pseudomonadota bacterium]
MSTDQAHNRFLLGALSLGHFTNDWVAGTLWILAPAIAASMGLGPAEVGLILAINGIGAGLAYVPAGVLADRSSRPGLLMLLTFWWVAIGYFCATLAPGFWGVTLLLAFGVMGDAAWHPVATGVLVKQMPKKRAQVLGIHAVGGSIGAEVFGPISAGFLLGYFSWQTTLQILVIPAVLVGIVFIPIARKIGTVQKQKMSSYEFVTLLRHWFSPRGLQLVVLMISYNMALMATLAMTPLFFQSEHGLDAFYTSVIFAVILLLGTFFQPLAGKASDRIGRGVIILWVMVASIVASLLAAGSNHLIMFVISVLVSIGMLTAVRPVILAAAVDFSSESESTTLGIVFSMMDGVGALGALCAGLVGEFDLRYAFAFSAVMASIAATLSVRFAFTGPQTADV